MRHFLLALGLCAGLLWLSPAPAAEAQGCVSYSQPFQGYLYGYCYSYPFSGAMFPLNVPFGNTQINFGFNTLNVPIFPSQGQFSALSFGFPFPDFPPYQGFASVAGTGGGGGGGGGGGLGSLTYSGFGFPYNYPGYPFFAGANITFNGYPMPIYGFPGSFGYNAGARRGFNPYATPDAYLKTLDAVALPTGGYQLNWTTGTTFSNTSHEIFQCPEADTPLVACRSLAVVNSEVRTYGPVPGGYTYTVRSQGYGGYTGTVGWGGGLESGSSRLPLPLVAPVGSDAPVPGRAPR